MDYGKKTVLVVKVPSAAFADDDPQCYSASASLAGTLRALLLEAGFEDQGDPEDSIYREDSRLSMDLLQGGQLFHFDFIYFPQDEDNDLIAIRCECLRPYLPSSQVPDVGILEDPLKRFGADHEMHYFLTAQEFESRY